MSVPGATQLLQLQRENRRYVSLAASLRALRPKVKDATLAAQIDAWLNKFNTWNKVIQAATGVASANFDLLDKSITATVGAYGSTVEAVSRGYETAVNATTNAFETIGSWFGLNGIQDPEGLGLAPAVNVAIFVVSLPVAYRLWQWALAENTVGAKMEEAAKGAEAMYAARQRIVDQAITQGYSPAQAESMAAQAIGSATGFFSGWDADKLTQYALIGGGIWLLANIFGGRRR